MSNEMAKHESTSLTPMSDHKSEEPMLSSAVLSHSLSPTDPDNPMNWPLHRKLYASAVAWLFAMAVAFGITCYTAAIGDVVAHFDVSTTAAISGMSLYLFGIAFAPIYTPHVAERYGRSIIYLISLPICALFVVGAGLSNTFASLAVCRFFAGFAGGPCIVLIEGTFADIWSAETTNTYYAFLGMAAYYGAALGAITGGFIDKAPGFQGWRGTQYLTCIVALVVFLFGVGIPETYQREIPRRRARRQGKTLNQAPAQSGVTLGEMFTITVINPVKMLFTEPIVGLSTLFLLFNFAVVFQWFITVPAVLTGVYGFTIQQAGIAFTTAIIGVSLAAVTMISVEQITNARLKGQSRWSAIEYRLIPAMIGQFLVTASLFWIGWTASPLIRWPAPVVGTMIYVWGNAMIIFSIVTYLFDAYQPAGTLAALTIAAVARILFAGALPLVIVQMFTGLTGAWALSLFGFISFAMWPIPFVLFKFGPRWREGSKYNAIMGVPAEESAHHQRMPMEDEETAMRN